MYGEERHILEDNSTVVFYFNTTQFSSGAPFTLAGTPSVHARVDGSDTEITTGITLSADNDSKTGLNKVTWDSSSSASYAAGSQVSFFINAGTVDSVSVVAVQIGPTYRIVAAGTLASLITRGLLALPNAAPGANTGLPTVDASNRIAGIAGTITTLDALDTAQDSQHSTTQAAIADVEGKVDDLEPDLTTVVSLLGGLIIATGTVGSTGNDTTHVHLDGALTQGDDELAGQLLLIYDGSTTERHVRWITAWSDAGDLATLDSALPFTPEGTVDAYWVLAIRRDWALPSAIAGQEDGLATLDVAGRVSASADAINGTDDFIENFEAWADAIDASGNAPANLTQWLGSEPNPIDSGRVVAVVGAVQTAAISDDGFASDAFDKIRGGDGDTLETLSDQIDAKASQASVDDLPTNAELATALAAADDAVLAAIAGLSIPTVAQIWTTALTEAYRADGATGTGAQLFYEILANLTEFAISGTTKQTKRLDGTTNGPAYTLDDDAAPTAITRSA